VHPDSTATRITSANPSILTVELTMKSMVIVSAVTLASASLKVPVYQESNLKMSLILIATSSMTRPALSVRMDFILDKTENV
jgi:hypothetical protein